ncbi:putative RING-H2 finger protein ATL21B [Amaranthus tricolor]|uniref:putative RING-H2 finger protein ATL21B n=1 Tax=Amaranthus tricolor TaxID=29722 RepID=UPI0025871D7B|nr:putative RING-H2 finger protein ATL21B [Amaranthus tricolor]
MDLNKLIIPLILISFITTFPFKVKSLNCSISKCGDLSSNPNIRYPFQVMNLGQQPNSCGKPGFDVWCDGGSSKYNTLIDLGSNSGNFSVKSIDYGAQEMWINDPNNCLPKRLFTLNLTSSAFAPIYHQDFSFFNCSKNLKTTQNNTNFKGLIGPIKCLSGINHFIYAIPSNGTNINNHMFLSPLNCSVIAPLVKVPVQWPPSLHDNTILSLSSELHDDLRLSWYMPECRPCEVKGQMCGLEIDSSGSNSIICSSIPNQGEGRKLPLSTFIAVILVICSPLIVCVLVSLIIGIRHCYKHRRSIPSAQTGSGSNHGQPGPPHISELGLEEINIEFARQVVQLGLSEVPDPNYRPTIVISEIQELGQGPNRENENTCAICMAEYRRKDRIGTLPICGHYFHANCINKWLLSCGRFGKTCPICRTPVDSL